LNPVPNIRIREGNNGAVNPKGEFVLYWMIANRRLKWNYSLDRAIERAVELDKPLVVLEALDCDYKWASDRFHGFILEGMNSIDDVEYKSVLREVIAKKNKELKETDINQRNKKLVKFAVSKGFEANLVWDVLNYKE